MGYGAATSTPGTTTVAPPPGLGRSLVDAWTPDVWTSIDAAVSGDVSQARVAQKVFPTTAAQSAELIPDLVLTQSTFDSIPEGKARALVEPWLPFSLTESQAVNEGSNHAGQALARSAAKSVAQAEDAIIFRGKNASATLPGGVKLKNLAATGNGLLFESALPEKVVRQGPDYPQSIFDDIADAIATLQENAQYGPYALILDTRIFGDIYRPVPGALKTTGDCLTDSFITGGLLASPALRVPAGEANKSDAKLEKRDDPYAFGILTSLGSSPVTIYLGVDTITAFTHVNEDGTLHFRVFERVQYVVTDKRALLRLRFEREKTRTPSA